jgi:hypothetical protein
LKSAEKKTAIIEFCFDKLLRWLYIKFNCSLFKRSYETTSFINLKRLLLGAFIKARKTGKRGNPSGGANLPFAEVSIAIDA